MTVLSVSRLWWWWGRLRVWWWEGGWLVGCLFCMSVCLSSCLPAHSQSAQYQYTTTTRPYWSYYQCNTYLHNKTILPTQYWSGWSLDYLSAPTTLLGTTTLTHHHYHYGFYLDHRRNPRVIIPMSVHLFQVLSRKWVFCLANLLPHFKIPLQSCSSQSIPATLRIIHLHHEQKSM